MPHKTGSKLLHSMIWLLPYLALLLLTEGVLAQNSGKRTLDPDLYNGKVYGFNSFSIKGEPFLTSPEFQSGKVTISGDHFSDEQLNYDIYNQEVLVLLQVNGTRRVISFPVDLVEDFSLGGRTFVVQREADKMQIYEKIGECPVYFLRSWSKDIKVSSQTSLQSYYFTDPMHEAYLVMGDNKLRVRSSRDIAAQFEGQDRAELKRFIRKNKIRLKYAGNSQLLELTTYLKSHAS